MPVKKPSATAVLSQWQAKLQNRSLKVGIMGMGYVGLPLGLLFAEKGLQVVGVDPDIMGVGPVPAIRKLLKQAGLTVNDIDLFEVNEAFAAQAIYVGRELGLDPEKLNVNGGAIALGHPLGCTGARQVATLLNELTRRKGRYGVISMCVGGGMGAAGLFELAN